MFRVGKSSVREQSNFLVGPRLYENLLTRKRINDLLRSELGDECEIAP